jgi:hypothetical protein
MNLHCCENLKSHIYLVKIVSQDGSEGYNLFPHFNISVTIVLSNSMEQSLWKANSCLASQENPCLLWNPNVRYHVHKSLPLVPVLSQMHPVHTLIPCLRSIVILSSHLHQWSLPFRFSVYNFVYISQCFPCVLHAVPISFYKPHCYLYPYHCCHHYCCCLHPH